MKTLEDIRRQALAIGAELEIDGRKFNTAQEVVSGRAPRPEPVAPAQAPPAPAPAPPADAITRDQLDAALARRDLEWAQRLDTVVNALKAAVIAAASSHADPQAVVMAWDFDITYDRHGAITAVKARAS